MEIWKPLKSYPGYEGSTEGRIKNVRTQHILKPNYTDKGIAQLTLVKDERPRTVKIHRALAETFLDGDPSLDVRHKDRDRSNNRVDNLEYISRRDLIQEAFDRGSKKPSRQIPVRVIETGECYGSIRECSRATGCAQSDIGKYLSGKCRHVKGLHFEKIGDSDA